MIRPTIKQGSTGGKTIFLMGGATINWRCDLELLKQLFKRICLSQKCFFRKLTKFQERESFYLWIWFSKRKFGASFSFWYVKNRLFRAWFEWIFLESCFRNLNCLKKKKLAWNYLLHRILVAVCELEKEKWNQQGKIHFVLLKYFSKINPFYVHLMRCVWIIHDSNVLCVFLISCTLSILSQTGPAIIN